MGRAQQHQWKQPEQWDLDDEMSLDDDFDYNESKSTPAQKWDDELDEFVGDYDDLHDLDFPDLGDE